MAQQQRSRFIVSYSTPTLPPDEALQSALETTTAVAAMRRKAARRSSTAAPELSCQATATRTAETATETTTTTMMNGSGGAVGLVNSAYCDWEGRVEAQAHRSTASDTDDTTTTTTTIGTTTTDEDEDEDEESTTEDETENEDEDEDGDEDTEEEEDDGYERPDLDEPIYMSVGRSLPLDYDMAPLLPPLPSQMEAAERTGATKEGDVRRTTEMRHVRRKSVTLRIDDDLNHDGDRAEGAVASATSSPTIVVRSSYVSPAPGRHVIKDIYADFSTAAGDDTSSTTTITSGYASPPSASGSPVVMPRARSGRRGGVVAADLAARASAAASATPPRSPSPQRHGENPLGSSTDDGYVDFTRRRRSSDLGTHHDRDDDMPNMYAELGSELLRDMRDAELKQRFMHFLSLLPARPERRSLIDKLLGKRTSDHAGSANEFDWPVLMTDDGGGATFVEHATRAPSSDDRQAKRKEEREKKREERREKKKKEKKERKQKRREKRKKMQGKCSRCEELIASTEKEEKKKTHSATSADTPEAPAVPALSEEEEAKLRREREKRRERRRREKDDKRKRKSEEQERKRRKKEEKRERAERKKRKEEAKAKDKEERRRRKAGRAAASDGDKKPPRATKKKAASFRREVSGLTKKDLNFDRRWNEEYQSLLDKGVEGMTFEDMNKMSKLVHDFVYNAETYAKVIINELNVDDKKKTIKAAGVGGVAGGEKFIVQGILFKFCRDPMISQNPPMWLYGGWRPVDEYAMKAAGLELQGLGLIANPRLWTLIRHPLMTLIDYKGFRIVATCVLPLGPHTLCYGSSDGGKSVLASDPVFNKAMDKVGKLLNLKKHTVGRQRVPIIGPGDIEGHLGTDRRYYMLDYARLMPPEEPPIGQEEMGDRSVFFKMLRPEIVRKYHSPLSSDAFTGWSKYDTDIAQSEREIREATKMIFEEAIPSLARELDEVDVSDLVQSIADCQELDPHKVYMDVMERVNLVYRMHSKGINMRHLGKLRQLVKDPGWKTIILAEAASRCAKRMLEAQMRQAMTQSFGVSSESLCKDLILVHLNSVLGSSPGGESFLKHKIKPVLMEKFSGLLTDEEMDADKDLRTILPLKLVFVLSERWGILRLTDHVNQRILTDPYSNVRILPNDVQEIIAGVRKPPMIHVIDASMYIIEAMTPECHDNEAIRLLETALDHLTRAGDVMPSVPFLMWAMGRVEAEIARRRPFTNETESLLVQAITSHRRSLLVEINPGCVNSLATTMELYAEKLEAVQLQQQLLQTYSSSSEAASPSSALRLHRSAAAQMSSSWTRKATALSSSETTTTSSSSPSSSMSTPTSTSSPTALPPSLTVAPSASLSSSSTSTSRSPTPRVRSASFPSLAATAATALFASSSSFFSSLCAHTSGGGGHSGHGSRSGSLTPALKIARLRSEAARLRVLARRLAETAPLAHHAGDGAAEDCALVDRKAESKIAQLLST